MPALLARLLVVSGNSLASFANLSRCELFSGWSGVSAQARWLNTWSGRTFFISFRLLASLCVSGALSPNRFMPVSIITAE